MGDVDQFTFLEFSNHFGLPPQFRQRINFMALCLLLAVARDHGNAVVPTDHDRRSLYEDGRSDCETIQAG
jgi:hypothetical protein